MSPLKLLPLEVDLVLEKRQGKENLVSSHSPNGSEIVFTLLTEVVIVYMGISAIYIWGTGLHWLILGIFGGGGSWSGRRSRSENLNF